MINKAVLVVGVWLMMVVECWGQNLVPNGSFEQTTSCPPGWNSIDSCVGWFTEAGSPDALATCSPFPVSVPNNFCGFQYPFEGDNYAGLLTFVSFYGSFPVREIIGIKLIDSMIIGNNYHFSMRVCLAYNDSNGIVVATNKLGAKFSMHYHNDYEFAHDNLPQLYEDSIITDSINWQLLHWDYVADSSYQYVYIGNFFDNSHTDTLNAGEPYLHAYYYIDSVNLYCISAGCATQVDDIIKYRRLRIFPNPTTTLIQLHLLSTPTTLSIFNLLGEKVKEQKVTTQEATMDVSELPAGMYVVKTEKEMMGKFVKE